MKTSDEAGLAWLEEHPEMDDGSFRLKRFASGETRAPQRADLEPRVGLLAHADGFDAFSLEEEEGGRARRLGETDTGEPSAEYRRRVYALWPASSEFDEVEALRDFFEPYLARLTPKQLSLIDAVSAERVSFAELAGALGLHLGKTARSRVRTAIRSLVRQIALDDPEFEDTPREKRGRPRRDYEAERAAAWRVFTRYRSSLSKTL